jgi:hypothetical protein
MVLIYDGLNIAGKIGINRLDFFSHRISHRKFRLRAKHLERLSLISLSAVINDRLSEKIDAGLEAFVYLGAHTQILMPEI